jgi:hypothetical protein
MYFPITLFHPEDGGNMSALALILCLLGCIALYAIMIFIVTAVKTPDSFLVISKVLTFPVIPLF